MIRYVKLNFNLSMTESGSLPRFKSSAIRGGLGEMLLSGNCIQDGNCGSCMFGSECAVPRIYYHRLKIQPAFVQSGESLGYMIACDSEKTYVQEGDILHFRMTLFGDVIVHFSTILQGIYRLGLAGLGKEHVRFAIDSIVTCRGRRILSGNRVDLHALEPQDLMQDGRHAARENGSGNLRIRFRSPWTQKYQGTFLQNFDKDAFLRAAYRRIYMLHCLEGIPMEAKKMFDTSQIDMQVINCRQKTVSRFSNTHNKKIHLKGIIGEFELRSVPEEYLPYIYCGEISHIGKNTSLGFGRYTIESL